MEMEKEYKEIEFLGKFFFDNIFKGKLKLIVVRFVKLRV